MKKFEYQLLNIDISFFKGFDYKQISNQLNQMGSMGWELVALTSLASGVGQTTSLLATLKREIG